MSQLLNLMAFIKGWCEKKETVHASLCLDVAIKNLEEHVGSLEDDSDDHRRQTFLLEQLRLSRKSKYARHYSPQLTILAYLVHASSSAAYQVLLEQNG